MTRIKNSLTSKLAVAIVLASAVGLILAAVLPLAAQTATSVDGEVESATGGFRFPDGGLQATAFASWPAPVEDSGQQGCWDDLGASIACSATGQDGELQRGLAQPTPRFTDNGDGTVTDNQTGLIWPRLANCFVLRNWTEALSDAGGLAAGFCGLTDSSVAGQWRLPNVKELLSLVDYGQFDPALALGHPFTDVESNGYWTSTTPPVSTSGAWGIVLSNGAMQAYSKDSVLAVLPVRGGV